MTSYKLTSPRDIKTILEKHGFEFSKSLGQNFLTDQNIIDKIIRHAGIDQDSRVLEIGPGLGAMTASLAQAASYVLAVEIDKSLVPVHQELFSKIENIDLIYRDILDMDLEDLTQTYLGEDFKLVANLPYYITSPIIIGLLKSQAPIGDMVLMVQKEVAERLVAYKDTKAYGSLTVLVDYLAQAQILFGVSPNVFMPRPKVDSAVISLKKRPDIDQTMVESLETVVRASFNQRRKTIVNSLSSGLKIEKKDLIRVLEEENIDPQSRAENLSTQAYIGLAKKLEKGEISAKQRTIR